MICFVILAISLAIPAPSSSSENNTDQRRYPIDNYLRIRRAHHPSISPGGDELVYLTDISGVDQVWKAPADGGTPEQMTHFSERVTFVDWSPSGDRIAFGKDIGGNERTQIFLTTPEGGLVIGITNDPESIHDFGGWSHDGKKIAWTSNSRDPRYFDVYVYNLDTAKADLILEGEGSYFVKAWSPDNNALIVQDFHHSFDQDLYLVKIDSREVFHLTPNEGSVRYDRPVWAKEGVIYLQTDLDRDFMWLAKMTVPTGELHPVREEEWDITNLTISEDGEYLAYALNREGYSDLQILKLSDNTTQRIPKLRGGVIGGLDFSKNNSRLAMTFQNPAQNPDIYLYDFREERVTRITTSSTAGIPPGTMVTPKLIRYRSFDGLEIPAFFYRPIGVEGPVPILIHVHGGPESQRRATFWSIFQYFLNHGYAIFAPNVRGSTGYGKAYSHLDDVLKREDSVKDVVWGVNWLKDQGCDPDQIAIMGGSYGGYMIFSLMANYPDLWRAGISRMGIVNFRTFLENTGPYRQKWRMAEYGDLEKDGDFLDSISPIHKASNITAPLMVIQGANDPRVPQEEAEQIVEAMRNLGSPVEYLLFEDEGHGITKLDNKLVVYKKMVDFLDRHMNRGQKEKK
jgi:dipeptidyl aminopeptidase/acylaminoacyl peptidase